MGEREIPERGQFVRWLGIGAAAFIITLAFAWVLFVPATDWLARHDVGSAASALLEPARENARGSLLTLGAGAVAAGALAFTARNFTLSRRTLQLSMRAFELSEQGQVTDRYTKAIEQLGSDKIDVRIGGIYALERVARDSARDHPTVMEVLTAFVREHSIERWVRATGNPRPERSIRPDIQAALTVVLRRDSGRDIRELDLSGADLSLVDLSGASLVGTNFVSAALTDAMLDRVDLSGAQLRAAQLNRAKLSGAYLSKADLTDANLSGALLVEADLSNANFTRANLALADLSRANLDGADFTGAHLGRVDLDEARLGSAILAGADLDGAWWPGGLRAPEGWTLDEGTGRLTRQDADSDASE